MTKAKALKPGETAIYFNQWTGFESNEIRELFVRLDKDVAAELEEGDIIYIDSEPLHHNGKVYGWTKVVLSEIQANGHEEYRICFKSPMVSGQALLDADTMHKFAFLVDEERLAELITSRLPLSTQIFV